MRRSRVSDKALDGSSKRGRHQRGRISIRRAMHAYEPGIRVAIVLDGSTQGGMPHRRFQGRTGHIEGRQGRAWVVKVKDGNMMKTVVARPEHLRPLN